MPVHKKKRAFEKARPVANTKLVSDASRIRRVRVRGGSYKFRALRLKEGNFNWASEAVSRKTRVLNVVYNASNNELVRTNTLVKNCIVQIDATPLSQWYANQYGVSLSSKKGKDIKIEDRKSKRAQSRVDDRKKNRVMDTRLADQFQQQRLLACISSRPGQSGRADGYLLEGKELEFYQKKLDARKK